MKGKFIDLTGESFGMLTVTKRAENTSAGTAWYCNCNCGTKDFVASSSGLRSGRIKDCGCVKEKIKLEREQERERLRLEREQEREKLRLEREQNRLERKRISEQEDKDFDDLYQYVKKLMGFDENQSLSNSMVLRLKGLAVNKFIENKKVKDTANYPYPVILNTFKYCSLDIYKGISNNDFKGDNWHKFLYITKIVEKNINDVYMRMKNAERIKDEIENSQVDTHIYKKLEYRPIKKDDNDDMFADLW